MLFLHCKIKKKKKWGKEVQDQLLTRSLDGVYLKNAWFKLSLSENSLGIYTEVVYHEDDYTDPKN